MNEQKRASIVKAVRLTWDSLDSHLDYSTRKVDQMCASCGDRKFHAKCCKEYALVIKVLTELL